MSVSNRWIVTATGDRPLREIAKDLADFGFAVDQVLNEIGCITGSASKDVVKRISTIPGVADISPDEPIDIGPPGGPVTW